MSKVLSPFNLDDKLEAIKPYVKSISSNSSDIVIGKLFRLRIVLINGYSISLVNGPLTRSSINDGKITFEVGVIDRNGDLDYSLTDGDVLSNQDSNDLLSLIERVVTTYPKP